MKRKVEDKEGIRPCQQRLNFKGKDLDNTSAVAECDIRKESTIQLVLRLRGGMNNTNNSNLIKVVTYSHVKVIISRLPRSRAKIVKLPHHYMGISLDPHLECWSCY